ncbi:DUF445 domain-containing protein [Corynebacterium sp. H130]|uniref:DUF445 domain-containing protein n=1 Tax=Corynebacterium sp. H130 TaxID=3133444 RepID=UPI0030B60DC7
MSFTAMPEPADAAERRVTLRKYKLLATSLLILAAIIFLTCQYLQQKLGIDNFWIGLIRAGAEAGMVGGLADWFAVTALFKYPMGLKIPHTAIVKNKKDQVGAAMSDFVGDNFLNAELITEKVREFGLAEWAANWTQDPANCAKVSHEVGQVITFILERMEPAEAERLIKALLVDKATEPNWGPPLGRLLEQLIEDGKTEPLVEEVAQWMHRKAMASEAKVVHVVDDRLPTWAPRFVQDLVGDKVYRELVAWTSAVAANPEHEARQGIRRFIGQLAHDLQEDEALIARVEDWKGEIVGSKPVQALPAALWASASQNLLAAAQDPTSLLRRKLELFTQSIGDKLRDDSEFREQFDTWITRITRAVADYGAPHIKEIISETVERWDADEASDKIELMVGKDLQYIRLNGTGVGALVGILIFTLSQLLFG